MTPDARQPYPTCSRCGCGSLDVLSNYAHETISEAGRCANTARPLARTTSIRPKEGLAMKATRNPEGYRQAAKDRTRDESGRFASSRPSDTCTVPGCDRPYAAKGGCALHYRRQRTGYEPKTFNEKFWAKVDRSGRCWIWQGYLCRGYGVYNHAPDYVPRPAHRIAYELVRGPIPEGLVLDHLCRNTACVNPDHLEAVTDGVNILRGIGPSAINKRKTHCIHGHEFTPENTYIRPDNGNRQCRTCARRRAIANNYGRGPRKRAQRVYDDRYWNEGPQ